MSKTTPVRWWRSDEDRYRSRGTYVPPKPDPQWMIELLAQHDPELTAMLDRTMAPMWYRYSGSMAPDASPRSRWGWREGNPITDVARSIQLAPLDPEMTKVIDWYTRELPLRVSPDARISKWSTRHFGPSPLEDAAFALKLGRRDVEAANRDTNPIEEIRVGESDEARVMIGRHRDGTFTVLASENKPQPKRTP